VTDGTVQPVDVLPEGTRLLHVGPHKTGTTSLQAALYGARDAMQAQGVRHAGKSRNPASAVRAVTGQPSPTSDDKSPPSIRFWKDLVSEIRGAGDARVVVSSEFFAWAKPDVIARIADDLGRDRLHVVVTIRPLGRLLPSQWQQNVQAGMRLSFEEWLRDQVFSATPARPGKAFWWLHQHDQLIERWAAALGRDRVTAVVVDEQDHAMLLRVFEGLLGLRAGTLAEDRDLSNRSLTLPEVEAVRAFNQAVHALELPKAVHAKVMRFGSAMHMKSKAPGPDEPRIDTPQWALDRAAEKDREIAPAIRASGVRVIGNLDSLLEPVVARGTPPDGPVLVPPRVAAEMAVGVLLASGLGRTGGRTAAGEPAWIEPIEVARVSTWQLAAVLARRWRGSVTARIRRLAGRKPSAPAA
jgi:hypothetical protein